MATYTSNLNLTKIDLSDAPPDITVLNDNWDTIDEKLGNLSLDALGAFGNGIASVDDADNLTDGVWSCSASTSNVPGACVVFHKTYTTGYAVQKAVLMFVGVSYTRLQTMGTWSEWKKDYDEINPPTHIGQESITPLIVENTEEGSTQSFLQFNMGGSVYGGIGFYGLTPYIMDDDGNLAGKIYHEGDKPTAEDVGITYGTDDLTAGTSSLETGKIYLVYE